MTNGIEKDKQWGGKRANAGRSKGSFKYGEKTVVRRLPESWVSHIDSALDVFKLARQSAEIDEIFFPATDTRLELPMVGSQVSAGLPGPVEDFIEGRLDLNEHLIKHPAATFYVKVSGESMFNAGILPGDLLIVDRAENPKHKDIVVAIVDGGLTVKRLYRKENVLRLDAENPDYSNIVIEEESDLIVWGVVRASLHRFIK